MLRIVIRVVKMDDAVAVRVNNLLRQEQTFGQVAADLARHIVALNAVDGRVLVRILLLRFLVTALDQAQNPLVRCIGTAHKIPRITVGNIFLRDFISAVRHDLLLHKILYFLHPRGAVHADAVQFNRFGNPTDLHGGHALGFVNGIVGFCDCGNDFGNVKYNFRTVSFDDFHDFLLQCNIVCAIGRRVGVPAAPWISVSCAACERQ